MKGSASHARRERAESRRGCNTVNRGSGANLHRTDQLPGGARTAIGAAAQHEPLVFRPRPVAVTSAKCFRRRECVLCLPDAATPARRPLRPRPARCLQGSRLLDCGGMGAGRERATPRWSCLTASTTRGKDGLRDEQRRRADRREHMLLAAFAALLVGLPIARGNPCCRLTEEHGADPSPDPRCRAAGGGEVSYASAMPQGSAAA